MAADWAWQMVSGLVRLIVFGWAWIMVFGLVWMMISN
jgi:hypothetical protein